MIKRKPHSQETRDKIAARLRGIKRSPETRAKIAAAGRGRIVSAETRAKMAASNRGYQTPEAIEKTRQANLGKKLSPEHREKLRQAKLRNPVRYWQGKERPSPSAATRALVSAAMKGQAKPDTFNPHIKRPNPYNGIVFRSSYEVRVAKALDSLGVPWVYEPKRFDLGQSRYKPDFYLPEDDAYWEVKGWFSPTAQEKVELFRAQHPELRLVVVTLPCIQSLENAVPKTAQVL